MEGSPTGESGIFWQITKLIGEHAPLLVFQPRFRELFGRTNIAMKVRVVVSVYPAYKLGEDFRAEIDGIALKCVYVRLNAGRNNIYGCVSEIAGGIRNLLMKSLYDS